MSQTNEFNLDTLLNLTTQLSALVNRETEALKMMRISDISGLQTEKNEVAAKLEKQQNALRENASIRESLTVEQKAALKQSAIEFDTAIQNYQVELYKAKKVNEMIIGKMVDIVKDHVLKNRPYGRSGARTMSGTELAKNTPALKYNAQA